jgi:DUF1009 family protein
MIDFFKDQGRDERDDGRAGEACADLFGRAARHAYAEDVVEPSEAQHRLAHWRSRRRARQEGIELIDSTYFLEDHLAPKGVLTKREPNDIERENIEYGLHIADEIARLDLGQTIVLRAKRVSLSKRWKEQMRRSAGRVSWRTGKLTVVKVAKPDQDMRFDVPVVGVPTIETMIAAGATCLSITAGKTLIFDRNEMLKLADKNGISVVRLVAETFWQ